MIESATAAGLFILAAGVWVVFAVQLRRHRAERAAVAAQRAERAATRQMFWQLVETNWSPREQQIAEDNAHNRW